MAETKTVKYNHGQVVVSEPITCKNCGSNAVVKFGSYKGVQRYWCKSCKRKFKGDTDLFHMKTSPEQISSALRMYYDGMSIKDIKGLLKQEYDNDPSKKTIYQWVDKYTDIATKEARDYHPKVGDTWIADETVLRIGGQNVWMYDIIDDKTRFLLTTRMAFSRTTHDAEMLMKEAQSKAGKTPKVIVTDKNSSYLDSIELTFGADTEHVQSRPFTADTHSTQKIERWHETLKERTKVMKGLKTIDTAIQFVDGFLVHYNYFRGNEALDGKTPAEVAGIKFPYKDWAEIIRQPVSKQTELQTHLTPRVKTPRTVLPETHVGRARKRTRAKPRGDIYEGHGQIARRPFSGAKRHKGKII
jgi:transposase-like protein